MTAIDKASSSPELLPSTVSSPVPSAAPQSIALPAMSNNAQSPLPQAMNNQAQAMNIELNDIHLPEPVNNYPIALGWWLLAIIILSVLTFTGIKYRTYKKLRKNKVRALQQLKQLSQLENKQTSGTEIVNILKWAAMQYFPRQQVAKLYGNDFQQFLLHCLPQKHQATFDNLSRSAFEKLYQQTQSQQVNKELNQALNQATTLWLTHALPPKKSLKQAGNS